MKIFIHLLITLIGFCTLSANAQHKENSKTRYLAAKEIQTLKEDLKTEARISNYVFKKTDKNGRLSEFTLLDMVKIEAFFMKKSEFLTCESLPIDKSIRVTTRPSFDYKAVLPELEKMGYKPINMRSTIQMVVFEHSRPCDDANPPINDEQVDEKGGCTDCGKQQVKQELLDKFKDADYGGAPLLEIDFNQPAQMDTSVSTDQ